MGRLKLVLSSPRWIALSALALLSLLLAGGLLSGASLTSRSGNSATLAAGSLRLETSRPGQPIIGADGMVPGESRSGTITVTDSGDVGGRVSLDVVELVDTPAAAPLSQALEVDVEDVTGGAGVQIWSGRLDALRDVVVGQFAAGQARTFRLTLSWPSGAEDRSLQGASTSFAFEWVGVS